ncbi:hypothetical protein [Streptomyces sp. NPDC057939]|uniref:hypothetical protein n=1 Tax=Streptomyces sp. NPDC057939 TaxID=3346284 RepID=UPI0036E587DA
MTQAPARTPAHPERLEHGHPFRQWKTWRTPATELTLTGYSRADDKTFFHLAARPAGVDVHLPAAALPFVATFQKASAEPPDHATAYDPAAGCRLHGVRGAVDAFFGDRRPDDVLLWAHPDNRLPEQHQHGGAHA